MHFKSSVDMLEASMSFGLLKGKFKVHSEFISDISSDSGKYIRFRDALVLLKGANKEWSKYCMEKSVNIGMIKLFKRSKFLDRWLLTEDVNKLRDLILEIKNPIVTADGRYKFPEIFNVYKMSRYDI